MHLSRKIPFSSHGHPNQLDPCILGRIPGRSNKHIRRSGHQLATLKKTKGNGGGVRLEIVWLCSCPHQSLAMARRDKCFGPSRSGSLAHLHLQRLSWRAIGKLAPCRRKETFGQRPLPSSGAQTPDAFWRTLCERASPAFRAWLGLHFTHRFLLEPMYDSCGPLPVP